MTIYKKRILLTSVFVLLAVPSLAQESTSSFDDMQGLGKNNQALKLSAEQQAQMKTLRYKHEKQRIDLNANLKREQLELKRLNQAEDPNRRKIHAQVEKVGQARVDIGKSRADHQLEVRKILTKEQYKTFQKHRNLHDGKKAHCKGSFHNQQGKGKRHARRG